MSAGKLSETGSFWRLRGPPWSMNDVEELELDTGHSASERRSIVFAVNFTPSLFH